MAENFDWVHTVDSARLADRLVYALKALEEQRVIYLEDLAEVPGRYP